MAGNKVSSSKKEIYTKLLDIAAKYTDVENSDFLKSGLFGYMTESMAMIMRDSAYHKSMIYNESFLNTAVIPKSVYNWAKMFNVEVQSASPAYADIDIEIDADSIASFLKSSATDSDITRYGSGIKSLTNFLILNKEDHIIAGDYYFSLEHSIVIYQSGTYYNARYITSEYTSTEYQTINNPVLTVTNNGSNIVIKARAYQYKRSVYTRQISSSSFLNNVQTYEFEDQFAGAKLFYTESNGSEEEVSLQYSDLSTSSTQMSAFYNLSNENELEIVFKTGSEYFLPSANSKITVYIYSTKGAEVESYYSGTAIMSFSDTDLKSLPLTISFNPTSIVGGKNAPTLTEIKKTIINEISTRNTITTESDLNNYFAILTSLIEDINDGKVTFVKKRDDILKRMFNAYLLLRDNTDDSSTTETTASSGYLSSCVPTNSLDINFADTELEQTIAQDTTTASGTINLSYLTCDESGNYLASTNNVDSFYLCPFAIFVVTSPIEYVKFIYNMTDSTSTLTYRTEEVSLSNDVSEDSFFSDHYMIPSSVTLTRGFDETNGSYNAEDCYHLTLTMTTDIPISAYSDNTSSDTLYSYSGSVVVHGINSGVYTVPEEDVTITSTEDDDSLYTTEIELLLRVDEIEFSGSTNATSSDYYNYIRLNPGSSDGTVTTFLSDDRLWFDFSNFQIDGGYVDQAFITSDELTFYEQLDTIMESSMTLTTDSDGNESLVGLTEVPVIHSSFFANETSGTTTRKEGFITQLFNYVNLLKENLERLETSTFFNLKFYNTYGYSNIYNTVRTNLDLEMEIYLVDGYEENTELQSEIRSYIRKIIDRMNDNGSIAISTVISLLTSTSTYGNYIDHVTFIALNDTFNQYISPLNDSSSDDYTDDIDYPPEWLNLDANTIDEHITFVSASSAS